MPGTFSTCNLVFHYRNAPFRSTVATINPVINVDPAITVLISFFSPHVQVVFHARMPASRNFFPSPTGKISEAAAAASTSHLLAGAGDPAAEKVTGSVERAARRALNLTIGGGARRRRKRSCTVGEFRERVAVAVDWRRWPFEEGGAARQRERRRPRVSRLLGRRRRRGDGCWVGLRCHGGVLSPPSPPSPADLLFSLSGGSSLLFGPVE